MDCPECGSELVYQEHVDGTYSYPIMEEEIDWKNGELAGDCYGHAVLCTNDDCGYELPAEELDYIFNCSLRND